MHKLSSKLDWSRMLGFDQVASDRLAMKTNGGKFESKVGVKIGSKAGIKT